MSKRRTRDQKRRTAEKKKVQQFHSPTITSVPQAQSAVQNTPIISSEGRTAHDLAQVLARAEQSQVKKQEESSDLRRFFGFDPQLLYRDLAKTSIISIVILVLLVVFSRLSF